MEKNTESSKTPPKKPFILEVEEAKKETAKAISDILNSHKLPCYIYKDIVAQCLVQLNEAATQELVSVGQTYDKQCEEFEQEQHIK